MYAITVRDYGHDEVNEVVGPFTTEDRAQAWITRFTAPDNEDGTPQNWFDIFELIEPYSGRNDEKDTPT